MNYGRKYSGMDNCCELSTISHQDCADILKRKKRQKRTKRQKKTSRQYELLKWFFKAYEK